MCGLLSVEFYRPYFNVNTSEVKSHLVQAAWPLSRTPPFLDSSNADGNHGQEAGSDGRRYPDLYGPVWVSATLVFVLAVVNTARRGVKQDGTEFDLVSTSMYSVLAYVGLGSVGLWAFFRYCSLPLTAAEALSVYGYSLTPFLVGTPLAVFSWPLRLGALATSSALAMIFILRSAWPRLQERTPERSAGILFAVVAAYHFSWFLFLALL
ncbi:unnamed protein product [Ascophyllum nodosum]